jgi:hypothetical protein
MKTHEQTNQSFSQRNADKKNGLIAGLFFIAATVSAIIGLKLYDPVLATEDYLTTGAQHANQIITGAVSELVLACANIGTGIMLYPYLRRFNESLGLGYVMFRVLEVVMILIGVCSVLGLLSLSQQFTTLGAGNVNEYHAVGGILKAIHNWTFIIGPHFMLGVNTSIYSYVFYRSGMVPASLALLGRIGAALVFVVGILELFGVVTQMSLWDILLSLPVASYEMILAGWLIAKGFNSNAFREKPMLISHRSRLAVQAI